MRLLICTQIVDADDPVLGFFHSWLAEFAQHCESVEVICLKAGRRALPENVSVHSLGKERGVSRIGYLTRFYYHAIRRMFQYDAVFIHMNPEYAIVGWPLWKVMRKRRVLWYTHKSVTPMLRLGSRLVDTICTASPESFRLSRKNLVVTGHGIDLAAYSLPRPPGADFLRLIALGRISRSKGLDIAIRAVADMPRRGVPCRFTIVGPTITRDDVHYEGELRSLVAELHLESSVTFEGACPAGAVPQKFAESDVLVHASTTGSLDKVVLEALAAQCLVISSNDAARPILGRLHESLVIHEQSADAVASAIERVYTSGADARRSMAQRGRVLAGEHSLVQLIERLVCILENK